MSDDKQIFIKHRRLRFDRRAPRALQAAAAVDMLATLDPVVETTLRCPYSIQIAYDLRGISFFEIEETLVDLGFSLDGSLGNRMKRSFVRYTEDIERGRLPDRPGRGLAEDIRRVFINRYRHRRHEGRDT